MTTFLLFTAILGYGIWHQQANGSMPLDPRDSRQAKQAQPSVLGRSQYQGANIYLSGGDGTYASGGLITQSSEEEAVVMLNGYDLSGTAKVSVFEGNREMVFAYLLRDKDSNQISQKPDISTLRRIALLEVPIASSDHGDTRITLPQSGSGVWNITVELEGKKADAVIVRSALGVVAKEGDNQIIFWAPRFL